MNIFSNRLRTALNENGMKPIDLSKKTKISKSSISDWLSGKYEAKQDKVFMLAEALDVDEAWLMGLDVPMRKRNDITVIYNQLHKPRQEKVYEFASVQLDEQNKVINMEEYRTIKLQSKLSAGTGIIDLDPTDTEELQYKGYVPEHDLAFEVSGDSMEPMFKDSEIIFVKKTLDIRTGQVIAVQINEESFIKKAYIEDDCLRLVSLNKNYEDIIANDSDDIRIVGRVIL